ncbi:MAG: type II and III secretion system protein family protein [Hyphomicrobiales bacterium]|nr:type II and III secretion system protein family protein [Hyphomicrobiales bacterium]
MPIDTNAQQVLLEVRLLEASRSAGRELGVSWWVRDPGSTRGLATGAVDRPTVGPPPPTNTLLSPPTALFTLSPALASGAVPFGTLVAQVLDAGIDADIVVQALEQKGLARRLAEPNLVALSGEKASFHAGGEVPIPVPSGDGDITIIFKEYGVRLNFTPVVLDDGLINLKLEPEVSEPDPSVTIRTNDIEVPGFVTRRASTTIELRDGQSFAMAGLLQTTHTKNQSQLPWLGQVPVLGALFRSSDFQKQETDLVIIVTPHIVKPSKPGEPLRTPLDKTRPANDVEFFLLGMQEVSDDMLRRFEKGQGIYGPYGHIIELQPGANDVHTKQ